MLNHKTKYNGQVVDFPNCFDVTIPERGKLYCGSCEHELDESVYASSIDKVVINLKQKPWKYVPVRLVSICQACANGYDIWGCE
jgi:hypothetical protein